MTDVQYLCDCKTGNNGNISCTGSLPAIYMNTALTAVFMLVIKIMLSIFLVLIIMVLIIITSSARSATLEDTS